MSIVDELRENAPRWRQRDRKIREVLAASAPVQLSWTRIRAGLYFSGTDYVVMQQDWHDWQVYRVALVDDRLRYYDYVNLGGYFPSAKAAKDATNRYITVKNEVAAIN